MKHALFVAFYYPPDASSSGVLRTLKYTRYLADHGWRVTVLSPNITAYDAIDEGMMKQIPDSVRVIRTRYWNTKRHLALRGRYAALMALPDIWIGWLPWALGAGKRIGRQDPIDVIYSTSPPSTAHLVAWRLADRLKRPWVADFRDPWIEEPPEPGAPNGILYRTLDRWLERKVVERCSHLITTTSDLRKTLATRYPGLPPDKSTTIPNGYDEADFDGLPLGTQLKDGFLRIVHAGLLNPHFRDPAPLFRALRAAADSGRLDPSRIRLRFLGGGPYADSSELKAAVADARLTDSVEFVPRMPYSEALGELAKADVLLLLQASEDTRGLVPAKLYEYLRMQKPVLALVLAGETSSVLEKTGGGMAIDPVDQSRLASALANIYQRWQAGTLSREHADLAVVRRYDRRELTRELAAIFERVI